MMGLSAASAKDIDPELGELIKIRASQINHCAFCLNMHLVDARKHGVSEQKLDVLSAWEEAGDLFTERERAALALTEAITHVAESPCPTTCTHGPPRCSPTVSSVRSSQWPSPSTRGTAST